MENICPGSKYNFETITTVLFPIEGHVLQENVDTSDPPSDHVPRYLLKTTIQRRFDERNES